MTQLKSIIKRIIRMTRISTLDDNKKATSFVSFQTALPHIINRYTPDNIIEFGPGFSTELFLDNSQSHIYSYESHDKWLKKYKNFYANNSRISIIKQNNSDDFIQSIQKDKTTLVFVDGGNRPEIIYNTSKMDNVLCVVHAAHRDDYYWSLTQFDNLVVVEPHCVVCWNGEKVTKDLADLPQDLSITSKYCTAPYRQAYQDTLMQWDKQTRAKTTKKKTA